MYHPVIWDGQEQDISCSLVKRTTKSIWRANKPFIFFASETCVLMKKLNVCHKKGEALWQDTMILFCMKEFRKI